LAKGLKIQSESIVVKYYTTDFKDVAKKIPLAGAKGIASKDI